MTMTTPRLRSLAGTLAFSLASFALAPTARADDAAASDVAAARELGIAGVKLADAGNCAEAIDKLARSEKMYHAPSILERLGECQVQTGKVVEGTENLNRVVRENLPPTAPPVFLAAQERARQALAEAKPKIAKLKIAVAAPAGADFAVTIDGTPVPNANLNVDRPVDPGPHTVEVTGNGFKKASAKVSLGPGAVDSVAITLERDPNAKKEVPPGDDRNGGVPAREERGGSKVPAIVAFSVGGAGIVTGVIFGVLAAGKRSGLDGACPNKVCPSSQESNLDSAKTFGWVSTIGFGVGIVGAAVGTVLLFTGGKTEAQVRGVRVQPTLGLGNAGFAGSF